MVSIWPPELRTPLGGHWRSLIARELEEADFDSLLARLEQDSSLKKINQSLGEDLRSLDETARRGSRSCNPIAGQTIRGMLEIPGNRMPLLNGIGIEYWTATEHCARAALRIIRESHLPTFRSRRINDGTMRAAEACLLIWSRELHRKTRTLRDDSSTSLEPASRAPLTFKLVFKLPSEKLKQICKTQPTRVHQPAKQCFRPEVSASLRADEPSLPLSERPNGVPAISKSRKRQILREDLQSVRDTISDLKTAERKAREQLEAHAGAVRAKKANLDNYRAELRRLEERIQSAERESDDLNEQQHRSETEVRRLQVELKRIAEVEAFKAEILQSYE